MLSSHKLPAQHDFCKMLLLCNNLKLPLALFWSYPGLVCKVKAFFGFAINLVMGETVYLSMTNTR